jgi:uncharacterized protein (TIGR02646 family)
MHKLDRDPVAPACLRRYRHGRDTWSPESPTYAERQDIWAKLDTMQGQRCAYCESDISDCQRHIEHFRQRDRYPQGTFDWNNLFGSCNRKGTCGDHKDKCGVYPPGDLLKPDVDDPDQFLVFSVDGSVRARRGLSDSEQHRAEATIRILGLDNTLNQIRRSAVAGYAQTAEELMQLAENFDATDWLPLLQQELKDIAHLPFATAIRHVLTRQS